MGAFDERSLDALEWNLAGPTTGGHDGCRWIERPGGTATASDQDPWPGRLPNSSRRKRSTECDHRGCRQQGGHPQHSGTPRGPRTRNGPRTPFGPRSTRSGGTANTGAADSSDGPGNRGATGDPDTSKTASNAAPSATTRTGGRSDTPAAAGQPSCPSRAQTDTRGQPG